MRPLPITVFALTLAMPAVALAQPAPAVSPPPEAPPSAPPLVPAQPAAPAPSSTAPSTSSSGDVVSLRIMLQKGIITQAEYESAMKDLQESMGAAHVAEDNNNFVVSKWSGTLYGFAEADYIYDSTQSFSDVAGSGLVQRANSYAGNNGRMQFGVRNSRWGLRFRAPEYHGIRASMNLESDFVVTTEPPGYTQPYQESENNFFTNPVMRVRHFYLRMEDPIVDVLFGQTWHLFGWQGTYHPATVQIQGIPGELYARTPQLRLSKTFKNDDFTFDIAVAALRPVQRDSGLPEGVGGIHLAYNKWTATQTFGATGTTISPLSVAVTGDVRHVSIPQFSATPANSNDKTSTALAVDAFVPVLPGSKEHMDNSLSVLGEFTTGYGITDLFTGMATGVGFPALPGAPPAACSINGATGCTAVYNPQIDPGIVGYDTLGQLHFVQFTAYRIGGQYYLPGLDGRLFLSANYSHTQSSNSHEFAGIKATGTLSALDWFDVNVIGDVTPAVRLGVEYANYNTTYVDGIHAIDHRIQGSAFYIF